MMSYDWFEWARMKGGSILSVFTHVTTNYSHHGVH